MKGLLPDSSFKPAEEATDVVILAPLVVATPSTPDGRQGVPEVANRQRISSRPCQGHAIFSNSEVRCKTIGLRLGGSQGKLSSEMSMVSAQLGVRTEKSPETKDLPQ